MHEWVKQASGESSIRKIHMSNGRSLGEHLICFPPSTGLVFFPSVWITAGYGFEKWKPTCFPLATFDAISHRQLYTPALGTGIWNFSWHFQKRGILFLTYMMNLFRVHLRIYQGVRKSQCDLKKVVGPHPLYLFFIIFWTLNMNRVIASPSATTGGNFWRY